MLELYPLLLQRLLQFAGRGLLRASAELAEKPSCDEERGAPRQVGEALVERHAPQHGRDQGVREEIAHDQRCGGDVAKHGAQVATGDVRGEDRHDDLGDGELRAAGADTQQYKRGERRRGRPPPPREWRSDRPHDEYGGCPDGLRGTEGTERSTRS